LRKQSCITQLLAVLHKIGQNLDNNIQSNVLYLDLAIAFDLVDHKILLQKLKCYGVNGLLLEWFTDYLNGRTQGVVVTVLYLSGPLSPPVCPMQGSILGRLLFVIFINDLTEIILDGTNTALYADDTKLHRSISSLSECKNLQQTIGSFNIWSRQNNSKFNAKKCTVLRITRKIGCE
jgi:hypothetical protein